VNLLAGALGALILQVDSFIRKDLFSVLLPGFAIVLELWIILDQPSYSLPLLDNSLLSIAIIVYISYIVGFVARQFSFFIAEAIAARSIRPIQRPGIRKDIPYKTSPWGEGFYNREAFVHNYELLTRTFGKHPVMQALGKHRSLRHLQVADAADVDYHELFHYCKIWLRVNAAALSTESMEIEFNLQLSIVPPVILLPFALRSLTGKGELLWIGLGVAALCAVVMYRRGNHLRHAEVFNVLRNLAIAQWCSETRPKDTAITQDEAVKSLTSLP
jgi:hypothetical protein